MNTPNFETYDLDFRRVHPASLRDRFDEIQDLRLKFYKNEFRRPEAQVRHYVGRLTADSWCDPNVGVGVTATPGQNRSNPKVVAAFDGHSDKIKGFMYAAENVSSKYELRLAKLHVPRLIAAKVGDIEREKKEQQPEKYVYVWGSEYVHDRERAGLVPILAALAFEGYEPDHPGTWYPWDEQTELKQQLTEWGYAYDGGRRLPVSGAAGFGSGSAATSQERWTIPIIRSAEANIMWTPGIREPLEYARADLAA